MIICRSTAELEQMREAGRLVGEVSTELAAAVAPGVSTADLDALAEKRIRQAGATPAFKGYHGYPATICASVNEEVIHGIPSAARVLREGDVVSIDTTPSRPTRKPVLLINQLPSGCTYAYMPSESS